MKRSRSQHGDMFECEDPLRASGCLRKALISLSQRLLSSSTIGGEDRLPLLWSGKFAPLLEASRVPGGKERKPSEVRIVREVALRATDVRKWCAPAVDLWALAHGKGAASKVRVAPSSSASVYSGSQMW